MHDKVLQARIDAFAETFLTNLRPALDATTPREMVRRVLRVCDDFDHQARGEDDAVKFGLIPLSFRMRFAEAFLAAYLDTESDADLLVAVRDALRALMREYARRHDVRLEGL